MYAPAGFGAPDVGDVEVFPHGDELHLFHLTLPNHDVVQHAVSSDGLSWRALPAAIRTGDPGECDDDMIWTMSVTERGGRFYMVYTALARAESGRVQRTALATSDDLVRWSKHPGNPVAEADERWYESSLEADEPKRFVSWRDPKPIRIGDSYFATVCARERSGPFMRRGTIGLIASPDLVHWEARPPLLAPRRWWDLECPQVFRVNGRFYATAAVMEDRTQRYWVADRFEGPYEVPADGGILAPHGHYAGRVCNWRGVDLFYCWHKSDYDWPGIRNASGKFVPAPLALFPRPDGSLGRRSFSGWDAYREPSETPTPRPSTFFGGRPVDGWRTEASAGADLVGSASDYADFVLEGDLALDARVGGLAFRLDERGGGYFVELTEGRDEARLLKWLPVDAADGPYPWFRHAELQRGRLPHPVSRGQAISFRLIVCGPYIECSLDGEVVLATLSAERTAGRVGVWSESGSSALSNLVVSALRRPNHV